MSDPTETYRRKRVAELNSAEAQREELEQRYGAVWDTDQLGAQFRVEGFLAPFVVVRRKLDGVRGTLEFQHWPRFYFNFQPE